MNRKRKNVEEIRFLPKATKIKKSGSPDQKSTRNRQEAIESRQETADDGKHNSKKTTNEQFFRKISASLEPAFELSGDYQDYLKSNCSRKMEVLLKNSHYFELEDHYAQLGRSHLRFINNTKLQTGGRLKIQLAEIETHKKCIRIMAQRTFMARDEGNNEPHAKERINTKSRKELVNFLNFYIPSKKRIRITKNITFNNKDVIPVFSDIPGETLNNLAIPEALTFNYTDVNIVNRKVEKDLAAAILLSREEDNLIRCNCLSSSSSENYISCYENENCPCNLMNRRMQQHLQTETSGGHQTEFSTFKPILFSYVRNQFYDHAGFACSELCSCEGNCTNNSLMTIQKKIFPLEMYRTDEEMGFSLCSRVLIPAGTPIMEFCGQIKKETNLEEDNHDYAYQITYHDDEKWKYFLSRLTQFQSDYVNLLLGLANQNFYIDPKEIGNIGRIPNHSCVSNMELVRIYQKSLSPAHMRLVMVTLKDIYPRTPLTIDYGLNYVKKLDGKCMCGTFACRNNKSSDFASEMSLEEIAICINEIHNMKHEIFMKHVHQRILKKANDTIESVHITND